MLLSIQSKKLNSNLLENSELSMIIEVILFDLSRSNSLATYEPYISCQNSLPLKLEKGEAENELFRGVQSISY